MYGTDFGPSVDNIKDLSAANQFVLCRMIVLTILINTKESRQQDRVLDLMKWLKRIKDFYDVPITDVYKKFKNSKEDERAIDIKISSLNNKRDKVLGEKVNENPQKTFRELFFEVAEMDLDDDEELLDEYLKSNYGGKIYINSRLTEYETMKMFFCIDVDTKNKEGEEGWLKKLLVTRYGVSTEQVELIKNFEFKGTRKEQKKNLFLFDVFRISLNNKSVRNVKTFFPHLINNKDLISKVDYFMLGITEHTYKAMVDVINETVSDSEECEDLIELLSNAIVKSFPTFARYKLVDIFSEKYLSLMLKNNRMSYLDILNNIVKKKFKGEEKHTFFNKMFMRYLTYEIQRTDRTLDQHILCELLVDLNNCLTEIDWSLTFVHVLKAGVSSDIVDKTVELLKQHETMLPKDIEELQNILSE